MDIQTIVEIVIVVIAIIYSILKLIVKIKVEGLRNTAKDLILEAETLFETNKNDERMDWCISQAIQKLPKSIRGYVSNEEVRNIIQSVFDFIKSALEYNQTKSIESENENEKQV